MTASKSPGGGEGSSAGGHADFRYEFGTEVRDTYSFSAKVSPGGDVHGNFEYRTRYSGQIVRVHGRVLCVTVTGNKARVGGIVTKSTFPEAIPPDHELTWSVTDNGEGKHGPPDSASPLLGTNDAEGYCKGGLPYPLETEQDRGNIQVKGG
ncbi:MAG: hypothetical protein M3403_04540 [Gemmatimonadota bacterium]|nr:hypothetical protein [Gemmatimonadota bacterium]